MTRFAETSVVDTLRCHASAAAVALIGVYYLWHVSQYWFITDDAYISLVYARNLAETGELSFNPGRDPVEGYTNFLWTLLLAGAAALGAPLEGAALFLGVVCGGFAMLAAYLLVARYVGGARRWALIAPALLASSAGFACWSSGGLETQLFTALVGTALYTYARAHDGDRRFYYWTGAVLALAAMTRPEGLLVTGLLGMHRLIYSAVRDRSWPPREAWLGVAVFAALWGPYFVWRWWYYGHPAPNTYYAKVAGEAPAGYSAALTRAGVHYAGQWLRQSGAVVGIPLALVGYLWVRRQPLRLFIGSSALLVSTVYVAYTVSVGGDFMGLHRFVMPVTWIVAVGAAIGVWTLGRRSPGGVRALLALGLLCAHALFQLDLSRSSIAAGNWASDRGIDTPAFLRDYARDRARIGEQFAGCLRPDDFSIFGGAGAKPFHAGARGIDVFGLVSERIAHEVPPTRPRPGHNKWAPDRFLLDYQPEFVFSCYSLQPDPGEPRWNCRPENWKRHGYEVITMHIPGLVERGEYYSFLARRDRQFDCPGIVRREP